MMSESEQNGFAECWNQFIHEQTQENQILLQQSVSFNDSHSILTLSWLKIRIAFKSDSIFAPLMQLLIMFEGLDFKALNTLIIEIGDDEKSSELSLINQIQNSLRTLKNLREIQIIEKRETGWNPFTFYLFFSYEISSEFQKCICQLNYVHNVIRIEQNINSKGQLTYQFVFTEQESQKSNIVQLSQLFDEIFSITHKNIQSLERTLIEEEPLQIKKQKIISFQINLSEEPLYDQILCAINLFRIWEFESSRIKKVKFRIISSKEIKSFSEEISEKQSLIDLGEFQESRIMQKTEFDIPYIKGNQFDLLGKILLNARGIKFDSNHPFDFHEFVKINSNIKNRLERKQEMSLKRIEVHKLIPENVPPFVSIAKNFPLLKHLKLILKPFVTRPFDPSIGDSLNLLEKLKTANLNRYCVLKKGQIVLWNKQYQEIQKYVNQILQLNKSFHLTIINDSRLGRDLSKKEFISFLEDIKMVISNQIILEFKFFSRILPKQQQLFEDLQTILEERNQLYNQVSLFSKLLAPFIQFSPSQTLYDLFN